jgi:hypothetical protein
VWRGLGKPRKATQRKKLIWGKETSFSWLLSGTGKNGQNLEISGRPPDQKEKGDPGTYEEQRKADKKA